MEKHFQPNRGSFKMGKTSIDLESRNQMKGVMEKNYLHVQENLNEKAAQDKSNIPEETTNISKETSKIPKEKLKVPEDRSKSFVHLKSNVSSEKNDENSQIYSCEVCKTVCTGLENYRLHLNGKKHSKNVKKTTLHEQMQLQLLPDFENKPTEENFLDRLIPRTQRGAAILECETCKKKFIGLVALKQHYKNTTHQQKLLEA